MLSVLAGTALLCKPVTMSAQGEAAMILFTLTWRLRGDTASKKASDSAVDSKGCRAATTFTQAVSVLRWCARTRTRRLSCTLRQLAPAESPHVPPLCCNNVQQRHYMELQVLSRHHARPWHWGISKLELSAEQPELVKEWVKRVRQQLKALSYRCVEVCNCYLVSATSSQQHQMLATTAFSLALPRHIA